MMVYILYKNYFIMILILGDINTERWLALCSRTGVKCDSLRGEL